jgi:hypothetical protein
MKSLEFTKALSRTKIAKYKLNEAWTKFVTEFFRKWGEDLGYEVHCREKYGGKGEYLTTDLVWLEISESRSLIVLALEHENNYSGVFENEVKKLVALKAILKILITYVGEPEYNRKIVGNVESAIKVSGLRIPDEKYMLMIGCCPQGKGMNDPFVQFYCYTFDNRGHIVEEHKSEDICTFDIKQAYT